MEEQITKNFTLSELTYSDTARQKGIKNIPNNAEYNNIKALCINVLQPLREALGKPVSINSCYRGKELNKAVGGATTSQHMAQNGAAADIHVNGMTNYDLAMFIKDKIDFDQLILEFYNGGSTGWVHVSYKSKDANRHQCLTINKKGTKLGLIK